ncbi:uncharacterized protein Dmul_05200 [Desulfococcus multivorans]|nr:uncharacterized protein Dmul_05200 [Desulfococcus multivorans]
MQIMVRMHHKEVRKREKAAAQNKGVYSEKNWGAVKVRRNDARGTPFYLSSRKKQSVPETGIISRLFW